MIRSIPIDVIRAFVAVVEARGFTRAAEDLGRSQPTISLQVKRLEELIETPLFEKVARFELTAVGSVCFDYGRRLLKLHDEMLDEAQRRKAPDARLRIGAPGELAARLMTCLDYEADAENGFEFVTGESETLALAFRDNSLDVAFLVGAEAEKEAIARWRAPLAWFRRGGERTPKPTKRLRLVLPPQGSAVSETAVAALRAAERPFDVVCASADFAVRSAAVAAGLGVAPMIDGLAPEGLMRITDAGLPPLPSLVISLIARGEALASAGRRWASAALPAFQPV